MAEHFDIGVFVPMHFGRSMEAPRQFARYAAQLDSTMQPLEITAEGQMFQIDI